MWPSEQLWMDQAAAARCMTAFQNGLLTLRKLRQGAHQRITVQYVNVSNGSQAVLGDVVKDGETPIY